MKIKKILFLLILLISIILVPSCTVNAAVGETFINDGVQYKILTETGNVGTVQITDYDNNKAQLIIPEIITYDSKQYTVVDIGYNAFNNCDTLTDIKLPNSITGIGDGAFSRCTSLTSIIIPDSVKAIPYNCFSGSTSLSYVKLPDSLECIRQSSFNDCSFKSLVIPSTVTSIEYNAFGGCRSLEKIVIPNSVTEIKYEAFGGINSLTIYGDAGSYAEGYANSQSKTFIALNASVYKVINDFTNITSDGVTFVESGTQNYAATLKAGFGSILPSSITIEMGGFILADGTDYTYNSTTGEVEITKAITGDVRITAEAVNTKKYVNSILTKAQSNGLDEVYPAEGNYVAMLISDIDYRLPETITVKVGATTLNDTQYKYNAKTGELIIYARNITDDITIEVIAEEIKYKVVFNADGGSFADGTDTLTFEDWQPTNYNDLEKPTRKGYEFIGYYNEDETSLDYIMNGESGIDEDMIFNAKWEKLDPIELFEESKNQKFVIGTDEDLIFLLDNDRGNGKVYVNGKELSEENGDYVWHFLEGTYPSIMLSEDYMKTLEVGEYTIKFVLDDGRECETVFTVIEQEVENKDDDENNLQDEENIKDNNSNNPATGDNIGIYVAMFIVSVLGIGAIILIKNKRQK